MTSKTKPGLCYLSYVTYDELVRLTGAMPSFDMALLARAFDDRREAIRVQLSRWTRRRGPAATTHYPGEYWCGNGWRL